MSNVFLKKKLFYFSVFIFILIVDQLSKYFIQVNRQSYFCNQNLALGIKISPTLFWILWLLIILFLSFILYKKYFLSSTLYLTFILSGAISNIIDRFQYGCVIDFINLKIWPAFNLADFFIFVGVLMIIIQIFKQNYAK